MSNPSGKLDVASTAVSLVGGILNYKTPVKAAKATANTTQKVAEKTVDTGAAAVKETVDSTVSAIKSIGSLFKSSKKEESAAQ